MNFSKKLIIPRDAPDFILSDLLAVTVTHLKGEPLHKGKVGGGVKIWFWLQLIISKFPEYFGDVFTGGGKNIFF